MLVCGDFICTLEIIARTLREVVNRERLCGTNVLVCGFSKRRFHSWILSLPKMVLPSAASEQGRERASAASERGRERASERERERASLVLPALCFQPLLSLSLSAPHPHSLLRLPSLSLVLARSFSRALSRKINVCMYFIKKSTQRKRALSRKINVCMYSTYI